MQTPAVVLFVLAIAFGAFAAWGLWTAAGRRCFDEMAGIIPLAALVLAIVAAFAAIAVWWFGGRASGHAQSGSPRRLATAERHAANGAPAATRGIDGDAHETIRELVWSGHHSHAEVDEMVHELVDGPVDDAALRDAVAAEFVRKSAAEQRWPRETDCDRLDRAFAMLESDGIVALKNAGTTMSDGLDDVAEARESRGAALCKGYCFFHGQDVQRALAGEGLLLAFGSFDDDPSNKREVGRAVRRALEAEGFAVTWDEDPDRRIEIPQLEWRRRSPM